MGEMKKLAGKRTTFTKARTEYFNWLWEKTGAQREEFFILIKTLHRKAFYWTIENDKNRSEDGKKLRSDFAIEEGYDHDSCVGYLEDPCTVLEMMLALSERMAFIMGEDPSKWFWEMIQNLGLFDYTDDKYYNKIGGSAFVNNILCTWLDRDFLKDGRKSPFPLNPPCPDQKKVEIWYQMHAYLSYKYNIFSSPKQG